RHVARHRCGLFRCCAALWHGACVSPKTMIVAARKRARKVSPGNCYWEPYAVRPRYVRCFAKAPATAGRERRAIMSLVFNVESGRNKAQRVWLKLPSALAHHLLSALAYELRG